MESTYVNIMIQSLHKKGKVLEEIKSLKAKIIIFFDPNFFAIRDYAIELMKELKKLKIRWSGSATINVAFDEELMQLAEESGCKGLLVGLESLNPKTLKENKKGFNDPNKYKEAIEIMQKHKIAVNGCFVLGLDGDTEELLLSIPEQINYLNLNLARFAVLTPVPNSNLYKRLDKENRIIIKDCIIIKISTKKHIMNIYIIIMTFIHI